MSKRACRHRALSANDGDSTETESIPLVVSERFTMRFALCLFVVGCSSYTITGEVLDEVAGTCTYEVEYVDTWMSDEKGKRTMMVRPYSAEADGCSPLTSRTPCDTFRQRCTFRIGYREPVYESVPEPKVTNDR